MDKRNNNNNNNYNNNDNVASGKCRNFGRGFTGAASCVLSCKCFYIWSEGRRRKEKKENVSSQFAACTVFKNTSNRQALNHVPSDRVVFWRGSETQHVTCDVLHAAGDQKVLNELLHVPQTDAWGQEMFGCSVHRLSMLLIFQRVRAPFQNTFSFVYVWYLCLSISRPNACLRCIIMMEMYKVIEWTQFYLHSASMADEMKSFEGNSVQCEPGVWFLYEERQQKGNGSREQCVNLEKEQIMWRFADDNMADCSHAKSGETRY